MRSAAAKLVGLELHDNDHFCPLHCHFGFRDLGPLLALLGNEPCGWNRAVVARPEQIPAVGAGFGRVLRAKRQGPYATL